MKGGRIPLPVGRNPVYRTRLEMNIEDVETQLNEFARQMQESLSHVSNAIAALMDTKDAETEVKSGARIVARYHVKNAQKIMQEAPAVFEKALSILNMVTGEAQ